ncbi:baseplate J/gp47 family protein [Gorillibacterium sp. CAU 1737]|uniref:baseplate assembly protein n=1 Tax=Gorillibacterium sp. CAU 1737 TaxID=3140362 RepID=UPI0032601C65
MTTDFKPVAFVETDAKRIEQELLLSYQAALNQPLYEADPRRLFLLQMVPILVGLLNKINYTGNSNLLPFAFGEVLDGLGARMRVTRLSAQKAKAVIRFTLSSIQAGPVSIPAGTRVTPDGILYFTTQSVLAIQPGDTVGEVEIAAMEGGQKYNGFLPGQIKLLVDPVPFVGSVINVTASSGGADAESDDAYRERQQLAPASFSVAGPRDAYKFWAKSADVGIVDVAAVSPSPGVVNLYPLMENGAFPSAAVLQAVKEQVSSDDRRPLTDQVNVLAPEIVDYSIALTYYISKERSAEESTIRAAIEGEHGAADQYEAWQQSKLGRPLTPDNLIARLYNAGAYRVAMTAPEYTSIADHKVAKRTNGTRALLYGGLI